MLDKFGLVDLERYLGDDDALALGPPVLDLGNAADQDLSVPGLVGILNPIVSDDLGACREIRAGDEGHQFIDRHVGPVKIPADTAADLPDIMRGHVCRHSDCNTA